jgi:hypothetical protein
MRRYCVPANSTRLRMSAPVVAARRRVAHDHLKWKFIWYDQMSNDLPGSERFYSEVIGWSLAANTMNDQAHTLLAVGKTMVGGLMPIRRMRQVRRAADVDGLYFCRQRGRLCAEGDGRRRRDFSRGSSDYDPVTLRSP